jgi:hypothetical protein
MTRRPFLHGYLAATLHERERLYTTIENLLEGWAHDPSIPSWDYAIRYQTVMQLKDAYKRHEKVSSHRSGPLTPFEEAGR